MIHNYRPMWSVEGSFTLGSGLAYDYDTSAFFQEGSTATDGPFWNTSPWNTTSWSDTRAVVREWFSGGGIGQNVSLVQSGSATTGATWHSTDYRIEVTEDLF
jgi:hypothetical protein